MKNDIFIIRGKKLVEFIGDETITEAEVPNGVCTIGSKAFRKQNNLKRIIIPEGVTTFERDDLSTSSYAFRGCKESLESISIPNSITGMPDEIFDYLENVSFNEYDNGLYLGNSNDPYVVLARIKDPSAEKMVVPEGTRVINIKIVKDCKNLRELTLPESLIKIEDENQYLGNLADFYKKSGFKMNLPTNYLKTAEKLPAKLTYNFMDLLWRDSITVEDCIWVYLFQSGKNIDEFCEVRINKDLNSSIHMMLSILEENPKPAAYKKLVKYAFINKEKIDKKLLIKICDDAASAKVKIDELKLLSAYVGTMKCTEDHKVIDAVEAHCLERYDYKTVDDILKKCSISTNRAFKTHPVLYADSKNEASLFAVKCAISIYLDSMHGSYPKIQVNKEAEELIEKFDLNSFRAFLKQISQSALAHAKAHQHNDFFGVEPVDRILPLVGRYADKDILDVLFDGYEGRERYYFATDKPETAKNYERYIKGAILLNDSNEARDYCIGHGWISEYAKIRGKKASDYERLSGKDLNIEDLKIADAVAIYEKVVVSLENLLDGTYSEPTVEEAPDITPIKSDNKLAERFFAAIRDNYKDRRRIAGYDYIYKPDELYDAWIHNTRVEEGHIGICLSIGLLVASYCFESNNISGRIVYCRNKWEYRGDCSESTRICLRVSSTLDEWKAYKAQGYAKLDM